MSGLAKKGRLGSGIKRAGPCHPVPALAPSGRARCCPCPQGGPPGPPASLVGRGSSAPPPLRLLNWENPVKFVIKILRSLKLKVFFNQNYH